MTPRGVVISPFLPPNVSPWLVGAIPSPQDLEAPRCTWPRPSWPAHCGHLGLTVVQIATVKGQQDHHCGRTNMKPASHLSLAHLSPLALSWNFAASDLTLCAQGHRDTGSASI